MKGFYTSMGQLIDKLFALWIQSTMDSMGGIMLGGWMVVNWIFDADLKNIFLFVEICCEFERTDVGLLGLD